MKKMHSFVNRTATLKRRNATIKHLKRENKTLLKTIVDLEIEKSKIITEGLDAIFQVRTDLTTKLMDTQEALIESKRKKWYQFIPKS